MTECSGFTGATFAQELRYIVQTLVIDVTRNWGKSVVRWNLALDENQGPKNGGCPNCTGIVTINSSNGAVTRNADYYALGHISKFVAPGAYRIETNTYPGSIENVAFKNPDGTKVVVVFNSDTTSHIFKIRWEGAAFNYALPAGAVATFKWSGPKEPWRLPRTGWIATASSSPTICCQGDTPAKAIDGDSTTRWSSGVAQGSGNQWFQIDLGATQYFDRIAMDAGASSGDYPRAYEVFVSNDGANWGDPIASGPGGQLTTIKFDPQIARYFRIVQTGTASNWWSIHELDVYASYNSMLFLPRVQRSNN